MRLVARVAGLLRSDTDPDASPAPPGSNEEKAGSGDPDAAHPSTLGPVAHDR